jgi:hypothetical protein
VIALAVPTSLSSGEATDDPVAPHFGGITGREGNGDGVVMHVQADVKNEAADRWRWQRGISRREGRGFCGSTLLGSRSM